MARHIFQSETELQNIPEAAPKASPSFSVSEKLARYGPATRLGSASIAYQLLAVTHHRASLFLFRAGNRYDAHCIAVAMQITLQVI